MKDTRIENKRMQQGCVENFIALHAGEELFNYTCKKLRIGLLSWTTMSFVIIHKFIVSWFRYQIHELNIIRLKAGRSDLHLHRFEGVPPAMPRVPHYSIISDCTVGASVVESIQIGRVTSRGIQVKQHTKHLM